MANLILAGAIVPQEANIVLLTIGSTTTVTDPLITTNGSLFVQGLIAIVTQPAYTNQTTAPQPAIANMAPIPVSNINGNVITVPFNTAIPNGAVVTITAGASGTNNLKDSAGLLLGTASIASCVVTNGSAIITSANLTTANGVFVGQSVSGAGIPVGAYIISMISGTSITLNTTATAGSTETLTIGQSINVTSLPIQINPYPALNAEVQSLFTNDPLIILLASGTFGKVVPLPGGWYRVYNSSNLGILVEFQATTNAAGVLQQLKGFQYPSIDPNRSALPPVNGVVNPYPTF